MNVEKISIEQAADILESAALTSVVRHGGMTATTLIHDGQCVTVIQAHGDDFLLVR